MPVAHGFYQNVSNIAYPHLAPSYWREQASRGLTTAVAQGAELLCPSDPIVGLAVMVEGMMEAGLVRPGEPLLVFADPTACYFAKQYATRSWPELVMFNDDDPPPDRLQDVERMAAEAHNLYFRSSLFVNGNYVKEGKRRDGGPGSPLGAAVDIWIVQAHTWQQDTAKNAKALGKELWAAYTLPTTGRYDYMRYYAGMWCWAHGPRQALVWAYTDSPNTMVCPDGSLRMNRDPEGRPDKQSFAIPRPDGTVMATPGYEGFEQGIKDCRYLERKEELADEKTRAYLAAVRASVPFQMPRPGKGLPEVQAPDVIRRLGEM
jgi:hypothetical protein